MCTEDAEEHLFIQKQKKHLFNLKKIAEKLLGRNIELQEELSCSS